MALPVTTTPATVTTTANGVFSANFTVPSIIDRTLYLLKLPKDLNSASETFTCDTYLVLSQQVEAVSVHLDLLATSQTQH